MKQNIFIYRIAQAASFAVSSFVFKRRILRNEIKGKKGPFVVIANHQAALDFVNLIGVTSTPMSFVISNSFYNSLPLKWAFDRLGLVPKQQFQTTVGDMKQMRAVIDSGKPLVIYPAGLMCEDGLSTPVPNATYKFLKWINADIYVARTSGTYFCMPKWTKGMRAGKTTIDIYKLFSKEELQEIDVKTVKQRADEALLFDAYREQEDMQVKYKNNSCIQGLENVLYMCPNCNAEYSIQVKDKSTIFCTDCGFAHQSDDYAFLHKVGDIGEEIRYVSDWSKHIYNSVKQSVASGELSQLSANTRFYMIDGKKHKFNEVGNGTVILNKDCFELSGSINGQSLELTVPIYDFASLPFSPGKHFEVQSGKEIYRCVLDDGRQVMKFINMVKACYELNSAEDKKTVSR